MEDKKKLIIITSIIAVGIPLFAIGTQTILKKARDDYYKIQKQQIEAEKAKERAEKEQRLAQEKAEREKQIQQEKEEKEKRITEERNERTQKAAEQKLQREQTTNAAPVFTPEPEVTTTEKHELTPVEVRKAKNALKEARASYFSGNKAAKPSKTSKNTDKIIIKSDSKGNVEAIRHTKEENAKAQRILKEIRDSYYKNSKR